MRRYGLDALVAGLVLVGAGYLSAQQGPATFKGNGVAGIWFANVLCVDNANQDEYLGRVGANDIGVYTNATNCAAGTLRADFSATALTLSSGYNFALAGTGTVTIPNLTANSFLYSGAGGLLSTTAAPTNGQLLVGSTGATPVAASLTGTSNQVTITNGAGTITLALPQSIATGSTPQFSSLGLGSAAGPASTLTIGANAATNGTIRIPATGSVQALANDGVTNSVVFSYGCTTNNNDASCLGNNTFITAIRGSRVVFGNDLVTNPAMKWSGSTISFRTGTDSADAPITASIINASTGFQINALGATGTFPRGNGTNYIASTLTLPNTIATGQFMVASATNVVSAVTPASVNALPANQTGNATATLKMNGLGAAAAPCTITPASSGRVMFVISGQAAQTTTADGVTWLMSYGTGAAPANAAAAAGTIVTAQLTHTALTGALEVPFSLQGVATGLGLVATWFDLQVANVTGGTASITNVTCSAMEF